MTDGEDMKGDLVDELKDKEVVDTDRSTRRISIRKREDLSKAIVFYGSMSSPMSEVTAGLRKVKLKRELEDGEEGRISNWRRLNFDEIYTTGTPLKVVRRNVRTRKR